MKLFMKNLNILNIILLIFLQISISFAFTNTYKNKFFFDSCSDYLDCKSCLQATTCGWCYSDGTCKNGNAAGSSQNECPFKSWTTDQCVNKPCTSFNNIMSCITQKTCFWCMKDEIRSGHCLNNSDKLGAECCKTADIDSFMMNPSAFKENVSQDNLNFQLEKISSSEQAQSTGDSSVSSSVPVALSSTIDDTQSYNHFLIKLKQWMINHKKVKGTPFNSITNPGGDFNMNVNGDNTNTSSTGSGPEISFDLNNFNPDIYDSLSKQSKSEVDTISSKLAMDLLSKMFVIPQDNTQPLDKTENYYGLRYYIFLEKIAGKSWLDYLNDRNVDINILYKLIGKNPNTVINSISDVVFKQNKHSLNYENHLNNFDMKPFKYNEWSIMKGTEIMFTSYLASTVIIFQQIRLNGQGNNFESMLFLNSVPNPALQLVRRNKSFSRIDLNHYQANILRPGVHNYYSAYKTDMSLDKSNDDNNIITTAIEFPYAVEELYTKTNTISINKYFKRGNWFTLRELNSDISNNEVDTTMGPDPQRTFLIFYQISTSMKKNMLTKLVIKNSDSMEYKETLSSINVFISSLNKVQNINGACLINLSAGDYKVGLRGKFIFEDSAENLEKIDNKLTDFNYVKLYQGDRYNQNNFLKKSVLDDVIFLETESEVKEVKDIVKEEVKEEQKDEVKKVNYLRSQKGGKSNDKVDSDSKKAITDNSSKNIDSNKNNKNNEVKKEVVNSNKMKKLKVKILKDDKVNFGQRRTNTNSTLISKTKLNQDNGSASQTTQDPTQTPAPKKKKHHKKHHKHHHKKTEGEIQKQNQDTSNNTGGNTSGVVSGNTDANANNSPGASPSASVTANNNGNTVGTTSDNSNNSNTSNIGSSNGNTVSSSNGGNPVSYGSSPNLTSSIGNDQSNQVTITPLDGNPINTSSTISSDNTQDQIEASTNEANDIFNKIKKDSEQVDSIDKIKTYLNKFDEIADYKLNPESQDKYNQNNMSILETGEITIVKLPLSTFSYNTFYKGVLKLKGNKELNELPNMKIKTSISTPKNLIIQINIVLTVEQSMGYEFRLYVNGVDDGSALMVSKTENIININNVTVKKYAPGSYQFELLYIGNKDTTANMSINDWDIISMNIAFLDIQ